MAKYSDIKGFTVQTVSTDHRCVSLALGGSWASGGSLNTAREEIGGHRYSNCSFALAVGGQQPGSFSPRSRREVESYNGTSWTEVADVKHL